MDDNVEKKVVAEINNSNIKDKNQTKVVFSRIGFISGIISISHCALSLLNETTTLIFSTFPFKINFIPVINDYVILFLLVIPALVFSILGISNKVSSNDKKRAIVGTILSGCAIIYVINLKILTFVFSILSQFFSFFN